MLLDTIEERTFKWMEVAKYGSEVIGPDSSEFLTESLPLRKCKYGVDVKYYNSELPPQKEMYFLHFLHLEITHLTRKAVYNWSFVVNLFVEHDDIVHITEEGSFYK